MCRGLAGVEQMVKKLKGAKAKTQRQTGCKGKRGKVEYGAKDKKDGTK